MFPENRFLEVLIIGALALIVIGPKDLPIMMRRVGQFVGKMRGMAAEFRASFDELARQSELDELRREVEALRANPLDMTATNAASPAPRPADPPAAPSEGMMMRMSPGMGQPPVVEPTSVEPLSPIDPPAAEPALIAPDLDAKPKAPRKPRAKVAKPLAADASDKTP